ncbi:methylmalonyl Co-A mutase-associated GTPase MeaB [Robiginitalea sp.]|uniref:methylmalonyl Co-A mutase-associated GTPase MeaB n=1 Tax=Robiginitalea sp. TaxID=1902411 RepID=UPI003C72C2D7
MKKSALKARKEAAARLQLRKQAADDKAILAGIAASDITALSQAITLIESTRPEDEIRAGELVESCLNRATPGIRVGITGVPGAGKSTFIETLGLYLVGKGHRVAILAVDPSSSLSKGSILGDKTRMQELGRNPGAFIRPSPAGDSLGGVARKTRESITLCEAAGFDIILVETVGVGQSEVAVHGMVDFFLLLKIAGAGDELQGIKRGIVEMADAIVINKADGPNLIAAEKAKSIFKSALHLYPPKENGWSPPVLLCSSTEGSGITEIWQMIGDYATSCRADGSFENKRTNQNIHWLNQRIESALTADFYRNPQIKKAFEAIKTKVIRKELSPTRAANELLELYHSQSKG